MQCSIVNSTQCVSTTEGTATASTVQCNITGPHINSILPSTVQHNITGPHINSILTTTVQCNIT